jgi:NAD(P)-dependent dehydrogenase (short-subunit alcohol dehydrogenase family)
MSTPQTANSKGVLAGRVALITGGARGIGRAIAEKFQGEGACVFVLDCDREAGAACAADLSNHDHSVPVHFVAADLLREQDIQMAVDEVARHHGRIDILVNNAGVEIDKGFTETSPSDWDLVMGVNLRGAFWLTQRALPLFPSEGGAVINISSIHARRAFPESAVYACSKAALVALTRNLALELAPRRIRVNAICPGYIDTRLWEEHLRRSTDAARIASEITALHPIGRRGQPADVGDAALFLASEHSAFITGTDLVVDGGLTIRAHA